MKPANNHEVPVSPNPPGPSAAISIEPFTKPRQASALASLSPVTRLRFAKVSDANLVEQRSEDWARSVSETILDVRDLADVFKCSREKIKRMARRGALPAFKFGKHWYVRQEDLERFLANQVESSGHLRRDQENRE